MIRVPATPVPAADGQTEKVDSAVRPVSVPEALALLQHEQSTREEFTYEQKLALDHAATFARLPPEKARELRDKLRAVSGRVTDAHASKLIDVAPTHADDVKAVFARDRAPLEKEEIDKILETVRAYL